ncbi:MAG TPA: hypothetical protein PLP23_02095 [Panacibacter sp.]|nr:hypothetical protein [Panacibacter sp.]
MEALKLRGVPANGILSLAVPDAFNNREVEVIVLSAENAGFETLNPENTQRNDDKIKRLLSVIGTAKYPNTVIDKYDAYNQ